MALTVMVKSKGKVTLTNNDYIAAGGEASVYKKGRTAFKIYHDPLKMIPVGKIQELQSLTSRNVLKPTDVIYQKNKPVGYIMPFASNTHPVCKVFTKTFRDKNSLDPKDIVEMVKIIQSTMGQIHIDGFIKCLVVDLNELNLLTSKDFKSMYFIDVDSYQTKSYPATAIMDSIRDRQG